MSGWNFAEVWETVAEQIPDAPCQVQGDRRLTWAEFDRRANGIAATLLDRGATEQDKVAQYLYNGPEYIESMFGAFKAGLVPINTNYRYMDDELVYLWDNADCVAVVFHGVFTDTIERIRDRVPGVATWLWVDDDHAECPEWAIPYEEAANSRGDDERVVPEWGRSGDQLLMTYTGGTTGMPKGVMWRQDDLFRTLVTQMNPVFKEAEGGDLERRARGGAGPGHRRHAGLPADARHGPLHAAHRPVAGRQHRAARRPQAQHRGAARHHRGREGQLDRHRGRRLRAADRSRPSTRTPAGGTCHRCS